MSAQKTGRSNPYIERPFQTSLRALWPAAMSLDVSGKSGEAQVGELCHLRCNRRRVLTRRR